MPYVAPELLDRHVADLMAQFNDAVGDDRQLRAVARAISSASGLENLSILYANPDSIDAPWHMLATASFNAAQARNPTAVFRIFGFVDIWTRSYAPQLGLADFQELFLADAPLRTQVSIATAVLDVIQYLTGEQDVFATRSGTVSTSGLTIRAAEIINAAHGSIPIHPATQAVAAQVLSPA